MKRILTAACCVITLVANSQQQLNEAVVSATRATQKTPVSYRNVSSTQINALNNAAYLPFILESTPSAVASSENGTSMGNTSVRIRGVDASRINVTLDGVPINDDESQAVYWANLPDIAFLLSSVQVQRGAGTSSNGSGAFGASINMQTATAQEPYLQADLSGGSYSLMSTKIKGGINAGKYLFFEGGLAFIKSDGYVQRSATDSRLFNFSGRYQKSNTVLKFNVLQGDQHTGLSWNGVPGYAIDSVRHKYFEVGVPGYKPLNSRYNPMGEYLNNNGEISYYPNQKDNYRQTLYSFMATRKFSKFTTSLTPYLLRGKGYYEEYKLNAKLAKYGINETSVQKSDLVRQKLLNNYLYGINGLVSLNSESVRLVSGLSATFFDNDHYGKVIYTRYNNLYQNTHWYFNNGTKKALAAFTRVDYDLNSKLTLYTDLQYKHISYHLSGTDDDLQTLQQSNFYNFFNPKAGLYYKTSHNTSLYASLAVAHREPARQDIKDALKNGQKRLPVHETMYNAESGFKYGTEQMYVDINLFHMYYHNQLVRAGKLNDAGYPLTENVPKSFRAGIEFSIYLKLLKNLDIRADLSLSKNKIVNFTSHTDTDWGALPQTQKYIGNSNLAFSPETVAGAIINYDATNKINFILQGKFVGKQYYTNTSNPQSMLPSYFTSNFIAGYKTKLCKTNVSVNFVAYNFLNSNYITSAWEYRSVMSNGMPDYVENGFFPAASRNFAVKLSVNL